MKGRVGGLADCPRVLWEVCLSKFSLARIVVLPYTVLLNPCSFESSRYRSDDLVQFFRTVTAISQKTTEVEEQIQLNISPNLQKLLRLSSAFQPGCISVQRDSHPSSAVPVFAHVHRSQSTAGSAAERDDLPLPRPTTAEWLSSNQRSSEDTWYPWIYDARAG